MFNRVVSWNIYTGPFVNDASTANQQWPARREGVLKGLLGFGKSAVLCLQEVTDENRSEIEEALRSTHVCYYNQTNPRKFGLLTAFPIDCDVHVMDTDFVKRPPGWVPACQWFNVYDSFQVNVVNVHASTKQEAREMTCESIADNIRIFDIRTVVCGDFNTFPDVGGIELVHKIQSLSGMFEPTSVLVDSADTSKRVLRTFSAFPDDPFKPSDVLVPFHLDHIFIRGLKLCGVPIGHSYTMTSDQYGLRLSDHMAISVDLDLLL